MTRYLKLLEGLELHRQVTVQSGGASGLRDLGLSESAIAQPPMTFGGEDLYPSLAEKACALGFSLIMNHPFADENKRIGHAAMEVFLILNGMEISASVDEQEHIVLAIASGVKGREAFVEWLQENIIKG